MNITILIIVFIFFVLNAVLVWFLTRAKKEDNKEDGTGFRLILDQLNNLTKVVDHKMGETQKSVNESMRNQFSESQNLIDKFIRELTAMTEKVTRVEETGKQMVSMAGELQSLQDILKNPKQRGILGEYYLETLLKNVLPPGSYEMQYKLGLSEDGKDLIPDAVVFVKDKIIPIDSKFSLENYNRIIEEKDQGEKEKLEKIFVNDLKNRITETSKYIMPSHGTMDFAFMFIPHEAIYYDLIVNKIGALKDETENLIQRAASKYKVIIVSPTSFLAYLQTVLQGLKAMKIEEEAQNIVKRVGELVVHLKKYSEIHNKLGASIGTVVNHFTSSSNEFKKIDKDIMRITEKQESIGFEPVALEKPDLEG